MITVYPPAFARFYDTIYHHLRDEVDNAYFQKKIAETKGKILEVGTGTGRLFKTALDSGADIYGIDISKSMLEVLRKKLPENQHYRISQQNMVDFRSDFRFDLIIAPFRVIMHLLEKEEQLSALNNIFDHLSDNGRFIFDVFIPDLKQLVTGLHNQTDFTGEYEPGKKLKRVVSTAPDLINQVLNITFHLEWEEGSLVMQDDWQVPLRYFFRFELEHLVERSKFKSYRIFGDYNENGLDAYSKEFIVNCFK